MLKKDSNIIKDVISLFLIIFASLYGSLYLEVFYESYSATTTLIEFYRTFTLNGAVARFCALFVLLLVCFLIIRSVISRFPNVPIFLFRYRFCLGALLLFLLVVFDISGSSISQFARYFGYDGDSGVIFGTPRWLRSDEYMTFTPMCVTQNYNGFNIYNDFLTGYPENVTMTYGSPTLSVVTLFRPFLWGFLVLGASRGLSFYWCSRLIVLALATFEFSRILTRDNRMLSVCCSILVTFSPMIQWWFGTAFTVEIVVAGELICVFLYKMLAFDIRTSIFSAVLIPWLGGVYLFALYPAWQIPCFYIFAIIGAILSYERMQSKRSANKPISANRTFGIFAISFCIVSLGVAVALVQGFDAIQATSSSLYPGARFETGGGLLGVLSEKTQSTLLPLDFSKKTNLCEAAGFFEFAPFSFIFGFHVCLIKKDKLLAAFSCLAIVFLIFGFVGFPEVMAKISLFSCITTKRLVFAIGLLSIFILIRALSLVAAQDITLKRFLVFLTLSLLNLSVLQINTSNIGIKRIAFAFIFALMLICVISSFYLASKLLLKIHFRNLAFVILVTVLIPGLCINPAQKGIGFVSEVPAAKEAYRVYREDPGTMATGDFNLAHLVPYCGAEMISVQVYPMSGLWNKIDPNNDFEPVWNRYAHVNFFIKEHGDAEFTLVQSDLFNVSLTVDDMKKLGVKYYISSIFDDSSNDILSARSALVGSVEGFKYYKL